MINLVALPDDAEAVIRNPLRLRTLHHVDEFQTLRLTYGQLQRLRRALGGDPGPRLSLIRLLLGRG